MENIKLYWQTIRREQMHCAVSYAINVMRNAEFWTPESAMKIQQLSVTFREVNTMP